MKTVLIGIILLAIVYSHAMHNPFWEHKLKPTLNQDWPVFVKNMNVCFPEKITDDYHSPIISHLLRNSDGLAEKHKKIAYLVKNKALNVNCADAFDNRFLIITSCSYHAALNGNINFLSMLLLNGARMPDEQMAALDQARLPYAQKVYNFIQKTFHEIDKTKFIDFYNSNESLIIDQLFVQLFKESKKPVQKSIKPFEPSVFKAESR